jgi:hypothetical protein
MIKNEHNGERAYEAVLTMRSLIPFFPTEPQATAAIALVLLEMSNNLEEMQWLVKTACQVFKKWGSLAELRSLYCSRFEPADGIRVPCEIPGYRVEDCEQDYHARVATETERTLTEARKAIAGAKLLPASEEEILGGLAALKKLPGVETKTHTCEMVPHPRYPEIYRHCETCKRIETIAPVSIPGRRARTPEEFQAELDAIERKLGIKPGTKSA